MDTSFFTHKNNIYDQISILLFRFNRYFYNVTFYLSLKCVAEIMIAASNSELSLTSLPHSITPRTLLMPHSLTLKLMNAAASFTSDLPFYPKKMLYSKTFPSFDYSIVKVNEPHKADEKLKQESHGMTKDGFFSKACHVPIKQRESIRPQFHFEVLQMGTEMESFRRAAL